MQPANNRFDWPAARRKVETLFPNHVHRGMLYWVGSSILLNKLDELQGLSDLTVWSALCKLAGIP